MPAIHIPPSWKLSERFATPEGVYLSRREVLRALGLGTLALAVPGRILSQEGGASGKLDPALGARFADRFPAKRSAAYTLGGRPVTEEGVAAAHNNFYEFTTEKEKVWELAHGYSVDPWKVEVGGLVAKPRTFDLDALFSFPLEERLYRFRCVERWAMQVPWTGFPLRLLLDAVEPRSEARWVRFESFLDRDGLPGQKGQSWYPWPYHEALRLDEARHPLAFAALGIYGHTLPMQHGAPLRLAIPWKYGFKGPKSVTRIELVAESPTTFWNATEPEEYGFFSNVDPGSPHPRWSQAFEQDIGTGETRLTLPFNGYAEEVEGLYTGDEI